MANEMLLQYIKNEMEKLDHPERIDLPKSTLKWTGSKIDAYELLYSIYLAGFTYLERYRLVNEQVVNDPVGLSINFMLENLSCKFKLSELAQVVNLSTSHYSRLFLSRTGHSPIDYFIQLKIQRSCKLLDSTNLSIAEVARETGFDDQFYFSRQFRKVMGMSPGSSRGDDDYVIFDLFFSNASRISSLITSQYLPFKQIGSKSVSACSKLEKLARISLSLCP